MVTCTWPSALTVSRDPEAGFEERQLQGGASRPPPLTVFCVTARPTVSRVSPNPNSRAASGGPDRCSVPPNPPAAEHPGGDPDDGHPAGRRRR